MAQSAQHGVLGDVLGENGVPDQPARQVVGGIQVRQHDALEIRYSWQSHRALPIR